MPEKDPTNYAISYGRETDGRWIAEIDALPGCLVYGSSRDDATRRVLRLAAEVARDGTS